VAPPLSLCTHLAESLSERELIESGTGAKRELLETIGSWSDSVLDDMGRGEHPIGYLAAHFAAARVAGAPVLCAHVNDCADDERLGALVRSGVSVVYNPRSSLYFGAAEDLGPHRYRDMLAAGINVCLGTDSIINLGAPALLPHADPNGAAGIVVLDEMRLLRRMDGADAITLLRMGTVNGAAALGIGAERVRLGVGDRPLGVLAVEVGEFLGDPLEAALASDAPPRFV